MRLGRDFRVSLRYLPIGVEQEGDTFGIAPVTEHSERFRGTATFVGEQWEVEAVLLAEPAVRLGRVERDAVDLYAGLLVVAHPVPEGAGLFRAAGGVVLGVEVENCLLPTKVSSYQPLSTLGDEL